MKTKLFISSYDLEIGGVERSLINMLESFDYSSFNVDLLLYRHSGELMEWLPKQSNLLAEIPEYAAFRKSIYQLFKEGQYMIGLTRLCSKLHAELAGKLKGMKEPGYAQLQLMWKYAIPFLPAVPSEYDIAISYLWPHDFVLKKVKAKKKLAWIHTDYSTVQLFEAMDLKTWSHYDHIIAVSEACKEAFLTKYPSLEAKVVEVENITSTDFIMNMANEPASNPMESDPRFKLLTVARLSYAKGIDMAVKALKVLKDRGYDDISWYVAGYGGEEDLIRELIAEHGLQGSFILLGKMKNPYPFIKACDLYVQPSRYEGKAVTVTEAQVLGKPVLITNYATANSQVMHGVDGYIADLSAEGIADGIERLYLDADLRKQLAHHCKNTDYANSFELEKIYRLVRLGGSQ